MAVENRKTQPEFGVPEIKKAAKKPPQTETTRTLT